MDRDQRREWAARGFKDPVVAYRQHAAGAGQRGIPFELTFSEWWELWEPHYERRGRGTDQLCMCRSGDVGPYATGNVRIDTVVSNGAERGEVYRTRQLAGNRLPANERRYQPGATDWMYRRRAFDPYTEDEEQDA